MNILGLDPGISNFGYSVIRVEEDRSYMKESYIELPELASVGMLKRIIMYSQSETLDHDLLRQAVGEILEICVKHNVDKIVIERWMKRPGQAVPVWVERLNHMIGAIIYASPISIKAIMASSWKRKVLNRYGIKSTKTLLQGAVKTEHEGDATIIALYYHEQLLEAKIAAAKPKRARKKVTTP